jgi:threonine/homoserine/homoserine lactone efflux protein
MLGYFFQGIIPGLILSVAIGPVFFMLITTSLNRGFKKAMILEAGIIFGDAFCILSAVLGLQAILSKEEYRQGLTIAGGIVLILFGFITWRKAVEEVVQHNEIIAHDSDLKLFWKGFFFNISNPSVIFFWMASVGIAINEFNNDSTKVLPYFSATLITVFSIDVLKAFLAFRVKKFLTAKNLVLLNRIAGFAIFIFGLLILYKGIAVV